MDMIIKQYKFLEDGGEMGKLVRSIEWEKNILGSPDNWPQSLRTTLSIILNSKFPMFLFWGPDLICFYNDAYRPSLGNNGKHPAAMGQRAEECWPEIWQIIKPLIDQVLAGGEATWSEDQLLPIYRNSAIEDVYWTFSYSPVRDESGLAAGVFVTCTETTEKVKNIESLRASKGELEFTIDATKLGTWDLNPISNKFLGNTRLKEWFGLPPDAEIELPDALAAIVEKDRTRVVSAIQYALTIESGGIYDVYYDIVNARTQELRHVKAKGKAVFDEMGKPTRFSGTLEDVTEEKHVGEKLIQANQRLAIALQAGQLGSYELNVKSGDMYLNEQCKANYGLADGATFNFQELLRIILPEFRDSMQETIDNAMEDYSNFTTEYQVRWPNDSIHWIRASGKPRYDENNKAAGIVGVTMDITEQKKLEQQKDDFLAIASHELKTPVSTIKAYTQLLEKLLESKGEAREAGMATKINTQVDRLTGLINNLLDVTKINAGKLEMNNSLINFNSVVKEMIEELQLTSLKHDLVEELDETCLVFVDRDRLDQVITNLITNAIKYAPKSNRIIVSSKLTGKDVTFCVKDFGIGIPAEKRDHVFEQFYRVSGDKQQTYSGLGLGLYISSEIIKRSKGAIWVESEEGVGSSFFFSLPVAKDLN